MAFAFAFESVLADMTGRIHAMGDPGALDPPGGRHMTGDPKLDRALSLIMRIRQEAALFMGDRQPHRGQHRLWEDEYYFALAVYGLNTGKYDYKETESVFALASAGVAVAQMEQARSDLSREALSGVRPAAQPLRKHPFPGYQVPLGRAHGLWKAGARKKVLDDSRELLRVATARYAHAIPLVQEYALQLAETGQHEKALDLLAPLEDLSRTFHDVNTLSRLGRTCKDLGDRVLDGSPVPANAFKGHPAWAWYQAAYKRYAEAFALSNDSYPGANAATLALLCGSLPKAQELAAKVLEICRHKDVSVLSADERFWLLVTQGEVALVLHRPGEAVAFYRQALAGLPADGDGMARSARRQVTRLAWALGDLAKPVVNAFGKAGKRSQPRPSIRRRR